MFSSRRLSPFGDRTLWAFVSIVASRASNVECPPTSIWKQSKFNRQRSESASKWGAPSTGLRRNKLSPVPPNNLV